MQADPLLEQLDWFFTSPNWTLDYPNTELLPLAKITSDHIPCRITVSTRIPKSNIFRFENFWVEHDGFFDLVHNCWSSLAEPRNVNTAKVISSKFKKLREELNAWSKSLSNLSLLIKNCNKVIGFLDTLEDRRGLYNPEANLRILVKVQVQRLLHYKNMYWKQRYTANRIKFGDECTKFFHTMATISFRKKHHYTDS